MSSNGNQVPLAPNQRGPVPYPRAPTPHRADYYHPTGAPGIGFIPNSVGNAQPSGQAGLRVQPTPLPTAPPAPQQDMSKTTMAGHNFVPSQNQSTQQRPQYANFQYRTAQHSTRPSTHPRQQQSFIPGTAATATGPVLYHHPSLVFQPTHMGIPQSYQQPRSQGYYPYVGSYIGSYTPASHTPPYYFQPNNQQLSTPNLPTNTPGNRTNQTTLGPQGTSATPTASTASIPHALAPAHMHQSISGIRPTPVKRSHAVPIIDPVTNHNILSDLYSSDSQYVSGESSERQSPQPEPSHSIAEEFTRMVNEVANQPSIGENNVKATFMSKNVELPISSTINVQPQSNAINSINNCLIKAEILIVNETKNLGTDIAVEPNETPVVSAISDSPVIVPKMPINFKPIQKNSEQNVQPLVIDMSKNVQHNKQSKLNKSKPVVPIDEVEKTSENVSSVDLKNNVVVATTVAAATPVNVTVSLSAAMPAISVPQPQRIREHRDRVKLEDKEKFKEKGEHLEKESPSIINASNGPMPLVIGSVDSLTEAIESATSQASRVVSLDSIQKQVSSILLPPNFESERLICDKKSEILNNSETNITVPTATERLSASIEKFAKDLQLTCEVETENKEASSTIEAQAKLTQSIASCIRTNQPEFKMKDFNLNNKTTDPDTANGNSTDITKSDVNEDIQQDENLVKNSKILNNICSNVMVNKDTNVKDTNSYENGKNETDKLNNVEQDSDPLDNEEAAPAVPEKPEAPAVQPVFVPKYKYNEDQWSPLNPSGRKCYDIGLLKQIKEDPLSKNKPNAPLLEACNVIRTAPMQEPLTFTTISRPMNESLFPSFLKSSGVSSRNNTPRDIKKDGRNLSSSSKGSVKLTPAGPHKPVIHVSLSLREDVKLKESENAWKPTRLKKENLSEEELKTEELYKKFRGILNKLTPQKFDTLLDKVKTLDIDNQKRLEGVIDLVFEKAIDEPNFSEAYAAMCSKLSTLKVPADNATSPEHYVNFRTLIISKCQNQFMIDKVDEHVLKLEKEVSECPDPIKKKELQLQLAEENRRIRMRSVGNVRFIGQLYKLKMLTAKIMFYCMNNLLEKLEEEKLECLCKLLTTIGEQVEGEIKEQLDTVFKTMQDIVERKANKISSRVRFMIQDVIELRRRRWVLKSVVDSQPKMMDQIQKEAEQQQRHIELMNANPMVGFRRDEGRNKRNDGRRQGSNSFMDNNNWKSRTNYTVDTSKLKAATQKNLSNIKLAPHNSAWNQGSSTKNTSQTGSSNSMISLTKNMYSVLENVQTDPTSLRGNKDISPYHTKGASIDGSTFNSRAEYTSGNGSRSGSMGLTRSTSSSRSPIGTSSPVDTPSEISPPTTVTLPQESLPDSKKNSVKSTINLYLINRDIKEMVADITLLFPPQYHAALITEIFNIALEKSPKEIALIAESLLHLMNTNTVSSDNLIAGMNEIFQFAPDLYIDIPMLYLYLAKLVTPQIENKHLSFVQIFRICENIISSNQGSLLLKSMIKDMKDSMGPSFVNSKWQKSGLQLKDWMSEDQVPKWIEDNKFEFLQGGPCEGSSKILSPAETEKKLLQLMNSDENCACIKGWVQDNIGKSSNEDWFMRALIQAICEHALFGSEGRDVPHFSQDRMNKYSGLINEFGDSREMREASCLFGIQQLIHRLEHPQGLTLEIFQYLHEQYIISVEGFIAWEESEKEPEGKGVMMKALTSFFTNIKEADNEDSCSEE